MLLMLVHFSCCCVHVLFIFWLCCVFNELRFTVVVASACNSTLIKHFKYARIHIISWWHLKKTGLSVASWIHIELWSYNWRSFFSRFFSWSSCFFFHVLFCVFFCYFCIFNLKSIREERKKERERGRQRGKEHERKEGEREKIKAKLWLWAFRLLFCFFFALFFILVLLLLLIFIFIRSLFNKLW